MDLVDGEGEYFYVYLTINIVSLHLPLPTMLKCIFSLVRDVRRCLVEFSPDTIIVAKQLPRIDKGRLISKNC